MKSLVSSSAREEGGKGFPLVRDAVPESIGGEGEGNLRGRRPAATRPLGNSAGFRRVGASPISSARASLETTGKTGRQPMATEVVMPKLGLTMERGIIGSWLKGVGDPVERGEPLLEVVTDKVTMEVEAQASGVLRRILVAAGEEVEVATPIGLIAAPEEDLSAFDAAPEPTAAAPRPDPAPGAAAGGCLREPRPPTGTGGPRGWSRSTCLRGGRTPAPRFSQGSQTRCREGDRPDVGHRQRPRRARRERRRRGRPSGDGGALSGPAGGGVGRADPGPESRRRASHRQLPAGPSHLPGNAGLRPLAREVAARLSGGGTKESPTTT